MKRILMYLDKLHINKVIRIKTTDIIFDSQVRDACKENKCGRYNQNFMCPPYVGEIADLKDEILKYSDAILIYSHDRVENPENMEHYYLSADRLHEIILASERACNDWGFKETKGLIAGHCRLCEPCGATLSLHNCINPMESRMSLEAAGIDVMKTCESINEPITFLEKEVTWVGMLLLRR